MKKLTLVISEAIESRVTGGRKNSVASFACRSDSSTGGEPTGVQLRELPARLARRSSSGSQIAD